VANRIDRNAGNQARLKRNMRKLKNPANFAAGPGAYGSVQQAATVAALTDSSGGTGGGNTIAVVTDNASAANAIATLAAKLNATLAALKAAGVMAP
jgi:hypothetical protein